MTGAEVLAAFLGGADLADLGPYDTEALRREIAYMADTLNRSVEDMAHLETFLADSAQAHFDELHSTDHGSHAAHHKGMGYMQAAEMAGHTHNALIRRIMAER